MICKQCKKEFTKTHHARKFCSKECIKEGKKLYAKSTMSKQSKKIFLVIVASFLFNNFAFSESITERSLVSILILGLPKLLFYSILAGVIGGGVWLLFFGAIGGTVGLMPKKLRSYLFDTAKKIDFHLQNTFKIPYAILLIVYYLAFIWLFVQFVGVLIYIADYLGFD